MVSNQLLQKTIDELKELVDINMMILDLDGKVIAENYAEKKDISKKALSFLKSDKETIEASGFQLLKVLNVDNPEYVLAVKGTTKNELAIAKIAKFQLETLIEAFKDRFDKDNFLKSLILDNLLQTDIYDQSKKLHLDEDAKRAVIILESQHKGTEDVLRAVRFIISSNEEDSAFAIGKRSIAVVKKLEDLENSSDLDEFVKKLSETLKVDIGEEVFISYGTIVKDLKDVSMSFREAKVAMEVGKIFFEDKKVNAYSKLGIGRLIYQCPLPVCKRYLKEIFGKEMAPDFDEEMMATMEKFMECSLNVSETSRQLFIHRNTLVYRLDRMQKLTGLDLRNFDDAITFKLAMMVSKYMKYIGNQKEK